MNKTLSGIGENRIQSTKCSENQEKNMKMRKKIKSLRWVNPVLGTCLFAMIPWIARSQSSLIHLDYEWADSVEGPWTKPPTDKAIITANGSFAAISEGSEKFFRLRVGREDGGYYALGSPTVLVDDLPAQAIQIAQDHLDAMKASTPSDPDVEDQEGGSWTDALLAPVAIQLYDPSYMAGEEPAYVEFKVVSGYEPDGEPIPFLSNKESVPQHDLGYILVSLHEEDSPVCQFSETGTTPCEDILEQVGPVSNVKIMRYGPTFLAVENEIGDLLANAGADPFRLPDDVLQYLDQTFSGEFDSETAEEPLQDGDGGPRMEVTPYESYEDFKVDYVTSPIYQELRSRRAQKVADEWTLMNGGSIPQPEELVAMPGEEFEIFRGQTVDRYFLDDDFLGDQPLAVIERNVTNGGLVITGSREGSGFLHVIVDGMKRKIHLNFPPPGGLVYPPPGFTPGWQQSRYWEIPGDYDDQPRYKQTNLHILCLVGCGPVAWAMLCSWWEHNGVPAMFHTQPAHYTSVISPLRMDDYVPHLETVYTTLYDLCDVICIAGAGATLPGDMVEAGPTYFWIPKITGHLGYSSKWSWDLMDPDWNEPSSVVRSSLKNHRPAIVGLGWMWHYAMAYKYKYQEFKVTENAAPLGVKRWFKCNQGWGKNTGHWYNGNDTFLGYALNPRQKTP
jgi:hypothetical protein